MMREYECKAGHVTEKILTREFDESVQSDLITCPHMTGKVVDVVNGRKIVDSKKQVPCGRLAFKKEFSAQSLQKSNLASWNR